VFNIHCVIVVLIVAFMAVTPSRLVSDYKHFRGAFCLLFGIETLITTAKPPDLIYNRLKFCSAVVCLWAR
jgi:hypothetical protein